ncbi:MAG: hypothetical protein HQL99_07800 [Magnetococcales bacterium]|nr:hypothetical protein [Magnetococcales bacterium]
MTHRRMTRAGLSGLLMVWLLSGCGYRFPAERMNNQEHGRWEQTVLTVEGVHNGVRADAVLTRMLDEILVTRMGPFATARSATDPRRLRVRLDAVNRDLILEDSSGRANQYRVTITARPELEVDGKPRKPGYPLVKGVATYYEPSSGTASRAARMRAETEAMHQLADSLVALLAADFQPHAGPPKKPDTPNP